MYAKLVLTEDGTKQYLPITDFDRALYEKASEEYRRTKPRVPRVAIEDGYNTRQILNYGYRTWDELFNERQLLCLTKLGEAVARIEGEATREAFLTLFSGTLEFNNMFASYKGEGTGAVRHMFSHHILKPERMPIEANLWGTERSSGAFSTLYRSRLLRALEYKERPFELKVEANGGGKKTAKVFGLSSPLEGNLSESFEELAAGRSVYLSCGSSDQTDLPDRSVDAVVTDPPFFDNVHYSELADFFYVWQQLYANGSFEEKTTRSGREVQDTDAGAFSRKLGAVLKECHRVLKDEGVLVFSYHHSRDSGWKAVGWALREAGFRIVAVHPVKAEMSVAQPKLQAKEPIDIDIVMVCRKRNGVSEERALETVMAGAYKKAKEQVARFGRSGKALSRTDCQVILLSNLLTELSGTEGELETVEAVLGSEHTRYLLDVLFSEQEVSEPEDEADAERDVQLTLF